MKQAMRNDATLFTHLFNNELDKFLLKAIQNKKILICENGFTVPMENSFMQKDVVQRLKNYLEIGVVQNSEKFIHLQNLKICEDCKNYANTLELSEMGQLVHLKIFQ